MQKSSLVAILKRLSKRDWREFRKFVRSPYFNQREDVVLLFDYIDEAIHFLPPMAIDRKKVFTKVYAENFDEKKLRHTTSFLLKILKKYLTQAEFEKDQVQTQQYLCKSFRKKGMEVFFEKELNQARAILEKEIHRDGKFYFKNYELGMEEAGFTAAHLRKENKNFQSTADHLTVSFVASMLQLGCEIQSHQTMSKEAYDLKLLPQILDLIIAGNYKNVPVINLYFHCYNSIESLEINEISKSEKHFQAFKKLIYQHWKLIPPNEIRNIYLYAINYCIKRLNSGERRFIREAFELFRSGLENETLLEEGVLSSFTYKNITRLGVALSENKWVEQFLEDYKKYLHPRERENTWRYNLAFFYFQQEKYKDAMQLLLRVEFKDMLNNLDARRMLLKSYFELGEYNALDSLLDSFSRYIYRQKEMGYHRDNYLNLIRFVKKIIQVRVEDKNNWQELKKEIESTTRLAEREWILEKLETTKNQF
ncbi:MAG: hypothetical protein AB8F94_14380 [Saprospiraceae bacterium]